MVLNDQEEIRINKYISSSGYCSRREADKLIEEGKVTIDGVVAINGSKVLPGQTVLVNGEPVVPTDDHLYIALNKPLGITCTTDKRDKDNIIDFLGFEAGILHDIIDGVTFGLSLIYQFFITVYTINSPRTECAVLHQINFAVQ